MPARDIRLVQWQQQARKVGDEQAYEVLVFAPGVDPLLVKRPTVPVIVAQSGSAKGFRARYLPPAPLFPNNLVEQPQTDSTRDKDGLHWSTTWSYVMAVDASDVTALALNNASKWPEIPLFETV